MGTRLYFIGFVGLVIVGIGFGQSQFPNGPSRCENPETTDSLLSRIDVMWVCKNRITGCEMIFGTEYQKVEFQSERSGGNPGSTDYDIVFPTEPEPVSNDTTTSPEPSTRNLGDENDKTTSLEPLPWNLGDENDKTTSPEPSTQNPVDEWTKLFPNFDFTNYVTFSPEIASSTERITMEIKTETSPTQPEATSESDINRNDIPTEMPVIWRK